MSKPSSSRCRYRRSNSGQGWFGRIMVKKRKSWGMAACGRHEPRLFEGDRISAAGSCRYGIMLYAMHIGWHNRRDDPELQVRQDRSAVQGRKRRSALARFRKVARRKLLMVDAEHSLCDLTVLPANRS